MIYYGVFKNGMVLLEKGADLPEGSEVDVTAVTDPDELKEATRRLKGLGRRGQRRIAGATSTRKRKS